jgi:5-formyltetrahydrofolate cyclo-ligase
MAKAKSVLRRELLARRCAISEATASEASTKVAKNVLKAHNFRDCQTAHIYAPITSQNEMDTRILAKMLKKGYPKLELIWGEASSLAATPQRQFDVIFTPVVGFNRDGFRLGFGGGWYDRFLAAQPEALKIGLAYDWAEVDFAPQPHDIPLDLIATETALLHVYL